MYERVIGLRRDLTTYEQQYTGEKWCDAAAQKVSGKEFFGLTTQDLPAAAALAQDAATLAAPDNGLVAQP